MTTPLAVARTEAARLRAAIEKHRDAVINDPRAEWLEGVDLELWLTLKEKQCL